MYTPKLFKQEDLGALLPLMQAYPFATVITVVEGVPIVSHLPILAKLATPAQSATLGEPGPGGEIVLSSHMARANPHWRHFTPASETLFIFHGPQSYVTPSWYKDPMSVPTWNYAVVHAYGSPVLVEDYDGIHQILDRTVGFFEKAESAPWKFSLPEDFKHELVGAIVGFEVRVARVEAKFKLSQNRTPEDRAGVLEGLALRKDEMSRKMLEMMRRGGGGGFQS